MEKHARNDTEITFENQHKACINIFMKLVLTRQALMVGENWHSTF